MKTKKDKILEYLSDGYRHRDIAKALDTSKRYVDLIYDIEFSDYEEPFDSAIMFEPLTEEDQRVSLKDECLRRYRQCRDFRDMCKIERKRWSESRFRKWIKTQTGNINGKQMMSHMKSAKLVYLSAPYTDLDTDVQEHRFRLACMAQAILMNRGIAVLSPLANAIGAVRYGTLELDHAGYMEVDRILLNRCDVVIVLKINGWEKSAGIQEEIAIAKQEKKRILFLSFDDIREDPNIAKLIVSE